MHNGVWFKNPKHDLSELFLRKKKQNKLLDFYFVKNIGFFSVQLQVGFFKIHKAYGSLINV